METIVIKFGGSSVADNSKLQLVANKVIKLYDEDNNVVVVVSAWAMPNVDPSANVIARDKDNLLSFMRKLLSNYVYIHKL